MNDCVSVEVLWDKLAEMEARVSFSGNAYPDGMCTFPFRLQGQGFFPGGDGLWRNEHELSEPSSGAIPRHGVMFLGNDFGTLESFHRLRGRGFENPPTWRHLKARVLRAKLPPDQVFCSNVVIGLRNGVGDSALAKKKWKTLQGFPQFCREFLEFQLTAVQPVLVVTLGPEAAESVAELTRLVPSRSLCKMAVGNLNTHVLSMTHPYGDFNLSHERLQRDADILSAAWLDSKRALVPLT